MRRIGPGVLFLPWSGAGEGNRTLVTWLGTKSSTIELHPRWHRFYGSPASPGNRLISRRFRKGG
jgi:hypothetical protein